MRIQGQSLLTHLRNHSRKSKTTPLLSLASRPQKAFGENMMGGSSAAQVDMKNYWEVLDKTSICFSIQDQPGILNKALSIFNNNRINLTSIQSKPSKVIKGTTNNFTSFFVDFQGQLSDPAVTKTIQELETLSNQKVMIIGTPEVPWFPTQLSDFDLFGKRILGAGDGIQDTSHPGFKDVEYRRRRDEITRISSEYSMSDPNLPSIKYTQQEKDVWKYCYSNLIGLFRTNACSEFNETIDDFQKYVGFNENEIPQLDPISKFLQGKTGWRLKPVGGLLTQREFLNGLAFRVFHSTQYMRHHSEPLYTPEPDVVHELLGHAPMFAHPDFADFSQEIGLASLGASEHEIVRLAAIYWFTLEFGMCLEKNQKKAYGAGILSSVGELKYCVTDQPTFHPLDPFEIAQNHLNYPISSMQPIYFLASSFEQAKEQIKEYCEQISKPFHVTYDSDSNSIMVDRKIKTRKEKSATISF